MRFISTRGGAPAATLSQAMLNGAAPDGGLYMPEVVPMADAASLAPPSPLPKFAEQVLRPYFAGDPLETDLGAICAEAFDFPLPLVNVDGARPYALELFHGPTGAFKDFGARFLMGCFDRLETDTPLTVLAATSGDTGGAVGCAAESRSSLRALILYPRGRVSAFQERQLTCWGGNVQAIEVAGDFDDCQHLATAAFATAELVQAHRLTSANSINIGRLLPQLAYSAWAAAQVHAETGETPGFVIPTGNLGHGVAVLLARAMCLPIGPVVLATNANATLSEWNDRGRFEPRPSVPTLANAMDVGNPSNFERLQALEPSLREVRVERVDDPAIIKRIAADHAATGYVWCPHSATAAEAWTRLPDRNERPWIVAATAHPYKFREIVEPLIGKIVEPSPALAAIASRRSQKIRIEPTVDALAGVLAGRAAPRRPQAELAMARNPACD